MTTEYRSYLAANILSEERLISYRVLSRVLKVHVNIAKQMLFEFHRQQNGKKPGTVHAVYVVAGIKCKSGATTINGNAAKDGEDEHMQSSPFRSSPVPNPEEPIEDSPVLSITLVSEENLEELQSHYEMITSIHIYSLSPYPLKNLQILSDAARETAEFEANQDPLEAAGTYGAIINKAVRRRTGQRLPPPTQSTTGAVSAKVSSLPSERAGVKDVESVSTPLTEPEAKPSQFSKEIKSKGSQEKRKASANPPPLKRDSSSIFKSFAKAKPPPQREGIDSSADASGSDSAPFSGPKDDAAMKDMSEGEEDDYMQPTLANPKLSGDANRRSRKEREAALKKMMEDDDDDQEDEESNKIMENQRREASRESPASQPIEEVAQVSNDRGRGRRRVMKKKTIRDDEGYLVTREELAWESFSEDEPVKNKPKPSSSLPTSSDKPKKGSNKAGQGSIMSFFGKK